MRGHVAAGKGAGEEAERLMGEVQAGDPGDELRPSLRLEQGVDGEQHAEDGRAEEETQCGERPVTPRPGRHALQAQLAQPAVHRLFRRLAVTLRRAAGHGQALQHLRARNGGGQLGPKAGKPTAFVGAEGNQRLAGEIVLSSNLGYKYNHPEK